MPHLFLKSEDLGSIIEGRARELLGHPTKRKRAVLVKELASVLRGLGLISFNPTLGERVSLAYGVRSDGTIGLLIAIDDPININGTGPSGGESNGNLGMDDQQRIGEPRTNGQD